MESPNVGINQIAFKSLCVLIKTHKRKKTRSARRSESSRAGHIVTTHVFDDDRLVETKIEVVGDEFIVLTL